MKTEHKIIFGDSRKIEGVPSESVDLMVTSPPYPMIKMWDELFSEQNPEIGEAIKSNDGQIAFELMNRELDKVWSEVYRVLKPGGIACINIGDAVRTINKNFELYSSHSRIITYCTKIGFQTLPEILWRKQTNAPNKFMGSGMLPSGAYVTLEHEHIIVLRKGNKREFKNSDEKLNRQKSSFFWEERNAWFSDIWEGLNGTGQNMTDERIRDRSAAYPFDLAYRLINMFSVKGDTVLDPYLGTGTTMAASMVSQRNSIGVEIDQNFKSTIHSKFKDISKFGNSYNKKRIEKHIAFMQERIKLKGETKYKNKVYNFPVVTRQEIGLVFRDLKEITEPKDNLFEVTYEENPNATRNLKNSKQSEKDIKISGKPYRNKRLVMQTKKELKKSSIELPVYV